MKVAVVGRRTHWRHVSHRRTKEPNVDNVKQWPLFLNKPDDKASSKAGATRRRRVLADCQHHRNSYGSCGFLSGRCNGPTVNEHILKQSYKMHHPTRRTLLSESLIEYVEKSLEKLHCSKFKHCFFGANMKCHFIGATHTLLGGHFSFFLRFSIAVECLKLISSSNED